MPLLFNTKIDSLRIHRSFNQSTNMVAKSLRETSSGLRIKAAVDDATGLIQAILAEMNIRSLRQSIQNLTEGLSRAQTLESAGLLG